MQLKNLILKPMGVLCFLTVVACEDNNITSDIENVEDSILGDVETLADGTIFPKESIEEIEATIKSQMQNHKIMKKAAYWSNTPHYVGVLAAPGSCKDKTMYIKWYMDCQDDEPMKLDKNATRLLYTDADCYKPKGATIDPNNGNVTWHVCIVDANKYKFKSMKYGYAIFDLSHIQYLNGAGELFVLSDDEDNRNANRYLSPSYGFDRNSGSNYLPTQSSMRNTRFWLYYFAPDPKSNYKLPNLGFEYEVFGNFDCCNNQFQNVLQTDSEDHNNISYLELYRPEKDYPKKDSELGEDFFYCPEKKLFNNNRVIKNTEHYMFFAIQAAIKEYRE